MSLFAVEMKVTGTFSSYLEAESKEAAEAQLRRRAAQLNPDSVVFESIAYQMQHCETCGEEHFGPACMKRASELLRPSWERAQL